MKAQSDVLERLNGVLENELTAISEYLLHARMLQSWGYGGLAAHVYQESIDEMKHADRLVQRILFLEGLPNLQDLGKLRIGESPKEALECDLQLEGESHPVLKEAIARCEDVGDYASRELLDHILVSEERHIDWLETQLDLIEHIGLENYLQSQLK